MKNSLGCLFYQHCSLFLKQGKKRLRQKKVTKRVQHVASSQRDALTTKMAAAAAAAAAAVMRSGSPAGEPALDRVKVEEGTGMKHILCLSSSWLSIKFVMR